MKRSTMVAAMLVLGTGAIFGDDRRSEEEVRKRLEAFNQAWQERDMDFIRKFYAHDEDMLLFFERRQLRGWSDVETLYENMFAHALPGSVTSTYDNLEVKARGDLAYIAANFHLEVRNPQGEAMTDTGRMSVVFERRGGDWVVIHRHTSFQAAPGPQRKVPLHTDPGPLWEPTLEGAWRTADGAMLLATASHLASQGVTELPEAATYRLAEEGLWVTPTEGPRPRRLVEVTELTTTKLVLRLPGGAITFRRVE